jgi:4a-hydroxytetrahydrobiopterin dehydratase
MSWSDLDATQAYSDAQIQARLERDLPDWTHRDGHLQRQYRTGGWRAGMMIANAVAHLAELAFHHPDLEISYPAVTVKLRTHSADGITHKDFDLARKIDEVVLWRPGREAGALEGIPDDPRFLYLRYD